MQEVGSYIIHGAGLTWPEDEAAPANAVCKFFPIRRRAQQ